MTNDLRELVDAMEPHAAQIPADADVDVDYDYQAAGARPTRSDHYEQIVDFMRRGGQDVPAAPVIPSIEVRRLRAKLIFEEAMETISGLGFNVVDDPTDIGICREEIRFEEHDDGPDFEAIVDGCADLSVVTIGTLIAVGVDDLPILEEVDRSNLSKFGPGHWIREDGKVMKSPSYSPAKYAVVEEFEAGARPPLEAGGVDAWETDGGVDAWETDGGATEGGAA